MSDDKRLYFVSVIGRSILQNPESAEYEWEIEATDEQAEDLRYWLGQIQETEEDGFADYVFPWPNSPEHIVNGKLQDTVNQVYHLIYELGTLKTRRQIEELKILE
ncbi:hypothetical protein PASE110613_15705 [Paenibacillus sediminis]|uniref:Hydrolase n=1 Tax=Paenibacillus sediminis TaxID=664909 RepID=A0ABS4H6X8_9BACL|nr:hypothetical protein [Paenibacillus sediminis]MBP1938284.1 hypothetical protein [Paenibacillus sediminis]